MEIKINMQKGEKLIAVNHIIKNQVHDVRHHRKINMLWIRDLDPGEEEDIQEKT